MHQCTCTCMSLLVCLFATCPSCVCACLFFSLHCICSSSHPFHPSIHPSTCRYMYVCPFRSFRLCSFNLFICLTKLWINILLIHLSLFVCLFDCTVQYVNLSNYMFVHLSICLSVFVWLSNFLLVYLFIILFDWLSILLLLVCQSILCKLPSGLVHVHVAQLIVQRWSVPEVVGSNLSGVRDFFSFSMWDHFLSMAIAQKVLFGLFIRALQLTTLKPLYCIMLNSAQQPNLTGYPFTYVFNCRKITILISHDQLPSGLVHCTLYM